MSTSRFDRYALTTWAAAAGLLAGCGGSQPPIGAPGALKGIFLAGRLKITALRAIPLSCKALSAHLLTAKERS